jgi:hypothetical protein
MKNKIKFSNLKLKKEAISILSNNEMSFLKAGEDDTAKSKVLGMKTCKGCPSEAC